MKFFLKLFIALMFIGCSSSPAKTKVEAKIEISEREKEEQAVQKAKYEQLGITTSKETASINESVNYTPQKPTILEDRENTVIVKVEGVGAIQKGNYAKARDEAIWDAQRRAVEKGVGVLLSSETIVSNSQMLADNLYTKADGFVDKYDILSENKDEYLYYITIKAVVKKSDLTSQLVLMGLIKKIGDPRIMVIIPEEHLQSPIPDPAAETEIIKNLVSNGYRVVDQKQIAAIRYSEKVKKMAEGDVNAAVEIGAQYGADIIITGEAFSQLQSNNIRNSGLTSCGSRVEFRVIKVDNGEIVAAGSSSMAAVGMSEAVAAKEALRKSGEVIAKGGKDVYGTNIDSLVTTIAKTMMQKSSFQIVINGITHDQYTKFVAAMKEERTFKAVFPREMSGSIARIDIDTDRDIDAIKGVVEGVEGIPLTIVSSTKNKIEAKISQPAKITINGVSDYADLKAATEALTAKGIKVKNRKFSGTSAVIETTYSGDMFELADIFANIYKVVSVSDSEVILSKK